MNRSETRDLGIVLAVAFLACLTWVLTKGRDLAGGDDAVMGLMALKISQGQEFPIFFWQAHYSGPIASYLAAPLHWFFEPSPLLLHSVVIPIHLFYSAGMYLLARSWMAQREALITGFFAALPAQLFPYSALGGFTESMAFVPWIFLLCLHNSEESKRPQRRFLWGGFLCGFALWIFPLAFPPVLACYIYQYKGHRGRAVKLSLVGCLLGLLPTIYYNLSQPGATILRLLARPSAVDRQAVTQILSSDGMMSFFVNFFEKWASASYQALLNIPHFTVSLFDLEADAAIWGHICGIISFIAFLFGLWTFRQYKGKGQAIPRAIALTVIITYCFLIIFGLNRDRYLIPILLIVPFGLALIIQKLAVLLNWPIGSIVVACLLIVNCFANFWDTKTRYPDYQGLARFLESKNLTRGYAPYLAAYPLVYLSNERLIYTPAFHEPEYDRRAEYTASAKRSKNPTFVFNSSEKAASFRAKLGFHGTAALEVTSDHHIIFYGLNPQIVVDELK
jgi:uncharacterized membrane protein YecN with MAPEG domain